MLRPPSFSPALDSSLSAVAPAPSFLSSSLALLACQLLALSLAFCALHSDLDNKKHVNCWLSQVSFTPTKTTRGACLTVCSQCCQL